MGRMLDSLKQTLRPLPGPLPEQCVVDWTLRDPDEVPFIEVGAGKKVEGSAQVMSVPVIARTKQPSADKPAVIEAPAQPPVVHPPVQPPHPQTEKVLAPKAIELVEAKPMSVAYEVWPGMVAATRGIAPEVISFHQPSHAISQQYATLLGKILEGQTGGGTKALLFIGSKQHVGTTTALLNLAVVAAVQDKRRLALIDGHLARPSLAQRLGLSATVGMQEVLAGNAALESAMLKTPVAGLFLLPARGDDNAAVGHVATEALAWLCTWLKERFDLVLIDGPGMDDSADVATFAQACDGIYLVVPQGESAMPHKALAQTIAKQGGRLKGLIHTHFEM